MEDEEDDEGAVDEGFDVEVLGDAALGGESAAGGDGEADDMVESSSEEEETGGVGRGLLEAE